MAICSQLPDPRPQAPGGLSRCVRDYGGGCGQRTEVRASGAEAHRPLDDLRWMGLGWENWEKWRKIQLDQKFLLGSNGTIYNYIYIYQPWVQSHPKTTVFA